MALPCRQAREPPSGGGEGSLAFLGWRRDPRSRRATDHRTRVRFKDDPGGPFTPGNFYEPLRSLREAAAADEHGGSSSPLQATCAAAAALLRRRSSPSSASTPSGQRIRSSPASRLRVPSFNSKPANFKDFWQHHLRQPSSAPCFDRTDWRVVSREQRSVADQHGPFGADITSDVTGSNSFCSLFFSKDDPVQNHDISGLNVWCNGPFVLAEYRSILQHYLACKAKAPTTTSGCFVVPEFLLHGLSQELSGMFVTRYYAAGAQLFTAPARPGSNTRRDLGPTRWPVYIFRDEPAQVRSLEHPVSTVSYADVVRGGVASAKGQLGTKNSRCSGDPRDERPIPCDPPVSVSGLGRVGAVSEKGRSGTKNSRRSGDPHAECPVSPSSPECDSDTDSQSDEHQFPDNPDAQGITFHGSISGLDCRIFLDSGATGRLGNFIDRKFAESLRLPYTGSGPTVFGFDDYQRSSPGTVRCKLAVPSHTGTGKRTFRQTLTFTVVDLHRHEIVLGYPFLQQHNPAVDWRAQTLFFTFKRQPYLLRGVDPKCSSTTASAQISEMNASAFTQLCRSDGILCTFLMFIQPSSGDLGQRVGKEMAKSELPPDIPPEVLELIAKYPDTFPAEHMKRVPQTTFWHRIELLPGSRPVSRNPYRLSTPEMDELRNQVAELLATGRISRSNSPFGAPVLFARKKDGGLRFCVDYRALNKMTVKNKYPLPRVDDLIDRLKDATCFSSLDLASGFWQVPLAEEDRYKTAFNTPLGQFQWTVMPFGLCNAPSTFQTMMDTVLRDFIDEGFVVVYMDDICIYSSSPERHLRHLERVIARLGEQGLYCRPHKCSFMKTELKFLGLLVGGGKRWVDPAVKSAVSEWPIPTTRTELRQFVGFCNFYRDFIEDFSAIAAPLTSLMSEKVSFPASLSGDHLSSFTKLRDALVSAPAMRIFNPDAKPLRLRLRTDASDYAIGAVLEQDFGNGYQPIAFHSKKFNDAQRNYSTYDRELLAIVDACKTWRCYLLGHYFEVYTDHATLKHFQTQPDVGNSRRVRWLDDLSEYDFDIFYTSGKTNPADALSRLQLLHATPHGFDPVCDWPTASASFTSSPPSSAPSSASLCASSSSSTPSSASSSSSSPTLDPGLRDLFLKAYAADPHCKPHFRGDLLYIGDHPDHRLYVPDDGELKRRIMREFHEAPYSAHPGVHRSIRLISRVFYWPGMTRDIKRYVRGCPLCHINKVGNQKPSGLLQPLPVPTARWTDIAMDFITGLPPALDSGLDSILVLVDRFSKMAHFIPCSKTITASECADLFMREIFRLHGLPLSIVSDRDKLFTSEFWQCIFDRLGTSLKLSSSYHPQTDGQTERMNRTLEEMLRPYCTNPDRQRHWERYLPLAEFAYNNTPQTATGHSPFYLCYGLHPVSPIDLVTGTSHAESQDYLQDLRSALIDAECMLDLAQQRMKRYADLKRSPSDLQVGDLVYISHAAFPPKRRGNKLTSLYYPQPFRVLEVIGSNAYRLDTPATWRMHNVFHASQLRRTPPRRTLVPDHITDMGTRYGQKMACVHWQDSTSDEDSWVPVSILLPDYKHLVDEYRAELDYIRDTFGDTPAHRTMP